MTRFHRRISIFSGLSAAAICVAAAGCECEPAGEHGSRSDAAPSRADGNIAPSSAGDAAAGGEVTPDDAGPAARAEAGSDEAATEATDGGVDRSEARDSGAAAANATEPGAGAGDAGPQASLSPAADAAPREPATTDARPPETASTDDADDEAQQIASLIQAAYRDARGFDADFEQVYRNRLMGRTQKSAGHVWLRPPDRMRWEYAPPSKNLIIADGRTLFVYEPEPNQVVQTPVSGSELPSVMAFLTGGRELSQDYTLRAVHGEALSERGLAGLELRPRAPSSVIARVVLVVARAAGQVRRTVLVDPEGNTNTFVWANVRTNRDLPDSRFTFTAPAGARIVER